MTGVDADDAPRFTLLGDQPYAGADDPLDFDVLAGDLSRLITSSRRSTPFTLGIEASWGMGKSTLMGRLQSRLADGESVRAVQFNAWTADEQGMLEGLVKTVLNELDENALRRALKNRQLRRVFQIGTSIVGKLTGLGALVDSLWDAVSGDPQARNELRALVEDAMSAWQEGDTGVPGDRLLCIFVDDLDRCSPEGVLAVFEGMKLYLNVPGIVFVVGYDEEIVSELVLERKGYSKAIKGRDYLEKFIQITYRIPRSGGEQSDAFIQALLRESRTAELFGETERSLVTERNARNPRRIKRFINSFVLSYGLDHEWQQFSAETLVRVHLVYVHFGEFARLLDRAEERDPLEEFLEYWSAYEALRRQDASNAAKDAIERAFEGQRLELSRGALDSPDFDALARRLDDNVPLPFSDFAGDFDFLSLIRSLVAAPDWRAVRRRLAAGRPAALDGAHDITDRAALRLGDLLEGMTILWIDDEPGLVDHLVKMLEQHGADIRVVRTTTAAEELLQTYSFDLMISDIGRDGDEEAGLDGLARLIRARMAPPFRMFFVARVTRYRIERARALGAEITNADDDVLAWLVRVGAAVRRSR